MAIPLKSSTETIEWVVDLGGKYPKKRFVVLTCAVLAYLLGVLALSSQPLGILGFLLICLSCAEVLLPIKYKITDDVVSTKTGFSLVELKWSQVRHFYEDEEGVKLTPLPKGARMEPFRGVYLRFANNRDLVLAKIGEHINSDEK